jgi:hypothetical protein
MRTAFALLLICCAGSCAAAPLLDGDCSDHRAAGVVPLSLADGVDLYVRQHDGQLWLCTTLSPGDFGTLDLQLFTPKHPQGVNLHVSAQLGQWPLNDPGQAPTRANSPLWWNHRGWSGTTLRFNGLVEENGQRTPRLLPGPARELQIDIQHFGPGEWRMALQFSQLGGQPILRYPAEGAQPTQLVIDTSDVLDTADSAAR